MNLDELLTYIVKEDSNSFFKALRKNKVISQNEWIAKCLSESNKHTIINIFNSLPPNEAKRIANIMYTEYLDPEPIPKNDNTISKGDNLKNYFTLTEFCKNYRISKSGFYLMQTKGRAPKVTKIGSKSLILVKDAKEWEKNLPVKRENGLIYE